ncbi:hypothetical protein H5392_04145 [Tessaracoccus sp. MC1865]|uniref:hypothetical protein n=1 Tax=Tessaracoccus sp. MC1865 TaxID=2760310 RepID=UPI0016044B34|nr:hypothetical protein [Tessaracoccus sp. MC1865]MBB1483052.1 hypothetical protein [Tessaracoccus sp. MC1865]QTO37517.1 hypothetical protein J7D54_14070 [Tessaracoccus sp. MC1865]
MPPWVKPALAGGVGVLLLAGGLVGGSLADRPEQAPSPSASPSPAFPLDTPLMVDDLVRGESSESTGPGPANQRIVQADYTDGENTVVFILSWPEPDVAEFVANAGIEIDAQTPSPTGGSRYCGVSEDTGESACGEVIDEVGVLLVSVTEQSETAVAETLDRFKEAIGQ